MSRMDLPKPTPVEHGPLWDSLTSDPLTGVSIIDAQHRLLYLNKQAAAIFLEQGIQPDQVTGKTLNEIYPPEFARERGRVVSEVIDRDQPVVFRAIWHGRQHVSWIYPIRTPQDIPGASPRVLVITRHVAGDANQATLLPGEIHHLDANVIDLGKLDALTPRELVVLALLGRGMSLKETAFHLHRSVRTIESQRDSITKKLHLRSRAELIQLVQRAGLTVEDVERERL